MMTTRLGSIRHRLDPEVDGFRHTGTPLGP